jgi:hypothetical protein
MLDRIISFLSNHISMQDILLLNVFRFYLIKENCIDEILGYFFLVFI